MLTAVTSPLPRGTACPPVLRATPEFRRSRRGALYIKLTHHTPAYCKSFPNQEFRSAFQPQFSKPYQTVLTLLTRGPASADDIAAALPRHASAQDILYRLRKKAAIVSLPNGLYSLPKVA